MTNLAELKPDELGAVDDETLRKAAAEYLELVEGDRKANQILFYQPASPRAQLVHDSKSRVLGIGGGNGCLPLDAPVLMADGSWKALGDIALGDMVIAADPETGAAAPAPVTHVWRSGRKPVYRVEFSDGGWFEATAEHMVPMYLGSGRTTSKGNAKRPHKRRLGDYIEPILRRGRTNPSKRISCVSPGDIQFTPTEPFMSPYLLGALLGDGSFSKGLKFHNADEAVIADVKRCVEWSNCDLIAYTQPYEFGIKGRKWHQNPLMDKIKSRGLWGKTSYTKFIPRECFGWDRTDRRQLLAGLIDTDGTLDNYSTCSAQLAEDIVLLIRSLGGKATLSKNVAKCQNGVSVDYFSIYWRLNEKLQLAMPEKQGPTERGRAIDYRRRICRAAALSREAECGDIEVGHPAHCYVTRDFTIVSNSSKTETMLVEIIMCATGIFPDSQRHLIAEKFKGPIKCRLTVESLTTTLEPIILPKLMWWKWTGVDRPGGARGHWGWIPKACLKDGEWDKSYSHKLRMLTLLCRNPYNTDEVLGESTIQFMSVDMDPSDFASGDMDICAHDEPPTLAIWRENEARTMRTGGRMMLAMTWPDDPSINVDWLYDEVYEPGRTGSDPTIMWLELWTTENRNLKQEAVAEQANKWSSEMTGVRIYGRPIRFSNRIHPEFTDNTKTWCFRCDKSTIAVPIVGRAGQACGQCGSEEIVDYNHVAEFDHSHSWPCVFILDPHPRKPHMWMWVQITPEDDWQQVAEGKLADDPVAVRKEVDRVEMELGLYVAQRIMDPNMGASPSGVRREVSWQDEFSAAKLSCDLANDTDVGRARVNTMFKPDQATQRPRFIVHSRCKDTVYQGFRYSWDDFSKRVDKDQKQTPKTKHDDYPTMWKYLANSEPNFRFLKNGAPVMQRPGRRRGAY